MSTPTTKAEFKEYCLRKLGKPVIEINVDDDQVDDRIDEALKYYWDYHFDGSERLYYKYMIQESDRRDAVKEITIANGGIGYSNTDLVVITANTSDTTGTGATANITTNSTGGIISVTINAYGTGYTLDPSVSLTAANGAASNGSSADLRGYKGGYIKLPENVMGVVGIFPIGDPSLSVNDIFNIRYQIALNDLYTLTSVQLTPYYMAMEHLALIQQLLVGQQPVRFNRHTDKLYIDTDWGKLPTGRFILIECYRVIDPDEYRDAWGDRWLSRYATALIKKQWGVNLKKFSGMQLPGGITFNGQQIYDEAAEEIDKLEAEMISTYSLPVLDMYG
jgi:hypothetical protein